MNKNTFLSRYLVVKTLILFMICFAGFQVRGYSQFILNGNASSMGGDCYELTPDLTAQSGQVWNTNTYNLNQPFDIQFNLFLGCKTYSVGADGIGFVFQQLSVNAGSSGGGMGFGGIVPSVGIEFDTYQNTWDPAFCHVAIEQNGDVDHTTGNLLAGPAQLSPSAASIPDCASHPGRITWDPSTQTLNVYFDCSLRLSYTGDIINNVFGGNPNVYWGFTGATGGASNTQQVCVINSPLNNLQNSAGCIGTSFPLSVSGGITYSWSPATGLNSSTISNPVATPSVTTEYIVTITDGCGFQKKDSVTITVYDPQVSVNNAVVCSGNPATLTATGAVSYSWSPATGLSATTGSTVTANPAVSINYAITGTDANGCTNTANVAVVVNSAFPVNTTQTNVSCNGGNDGTATAIPAGGTAPYTYSWSTTPVQTTATATGLAPGTYTVSVTDSPPCVPSGVELVPNGDFSSGNTGFSSSYAYTPPPNTGEGEYWVATAAQVGTWNGGMSSSGDHTNGTGNFMLVNGAGTPGSNVWCQTITVNPNTTYLFSTWVSSLNNSSPAILQFSVNGIPLGSSFNAPASANT
ncbi:MAG: lectin-like domain-containing protein, partial [Bacteroidia bacterium]